MVSVTVAQGETHIQLTAGLTAEDSAGVMSALAFVKPFYTGTSVATGQDAFEFAQAVAATLALLRTDAETRIAGLLFELPVIDAGAAESIEQRFGKEITDLVAGIRQLMRLQELTFSQQEAVH